MRSLLRSSVLALCATGLFACGGSRIAPNKEAAAEAAYSAGRASSAAQSTLRIATETPITSTTSVSCPHGGTASVEMDLDSIGTGSTGSFDLEVSYESCNYDGETAMSGTVTIGFAFVTSGSTASEVALTMSGRVNFSGAISDFVEMDLVQTVNASATSATSGTVTVHLDGTITTSSGTYTYDNETITITADGIDAES